jgi:hypothetical protein
MLFKWCPFLDPTANQFNLCGRERGLLARRRWHDLIRLARAQATKDFARLSGTRLNHPGDGTLPHVKPQTGLSSSGIRSVAGIAAIGQQGLDVSGVIDGARFG